MNERLFRNLGPKGFVDVAPISGPDLTVPRVHRGLREAPDAEHRVWYVAATRCRDTLHVASPRSNLYYGNV